MPSLSRALISALTLLVLGSSTAWAEFVPWKYNWSRSAAVLPADAPGTGRITLTDETLREASGSSDIVATNIRVYSTAPPQAPDQFTDASYGLTLFLLDETSGASGTMSFAGVFNGTVSSVSSNLRHDFIGETTKSLVLGSNAYQVTIGPYTPPGPPGSSNAGAVSAFAHVSIRNVAHAPEPSSLLIACSALPFVGLGVLRRRARRVVTAL